MERVASYRVHHSHIAIDGGVIANFKDYPYIPEMIDSTVPIMTVVKGAQMGMTIGGALRVTERAKSGYLRNGDPIRGIGYWFPKASDAIKFSKARMNPLLQNNPHYYKPETISADSAELKIVNGVNIYLKGTGAKGTTHTDASGVKSDPMDIIVLDERDEMADDRVDSVEHRLDASRAPEILTFSTPTAPGYGVDALYQESDQSSWHWRCTHCNEWVCFEDAYPECLAEPTNKDPFYICVKCREPFVKVKGMWVARRPSLSEEHRGLAISQLSSKVRTALDIMQEAEKAELRGHHREFENQVLGRPYADANDMVTEQQLNDCLSDRVRPIRDNGPSCMGVDPGKIHHYEVRKRVSDGDTIQIARGSAQSYEELSNIVKRLKVTAGVMDKGFDPSAVGKFCDDHPGFYGARYVESKTSEPNWNHKEREVKVGRTWLLDAAHRDIQEKRVSFYRKDDDWSEFVSQMTNLIRVVHENKLTGERKARWVVSGKKNDHLRHAGAYCLLASSRVELADTRPEDPYKRSRRQERRVSAVAAL